LTSEKAPTGGRLRRTVLWLWAQRIAVMAFVLSLAIELTIVATQVPYYAQLPGMAPTLADVTIRIYWMMPIITGGLTLFYGAAAAFVIDKQSGHYKRYLRLMWLFASIGALVNVTHSLRLLGDQDWITAVVLGGGSLASPLVLHSWTGLRIAVTVSGFGIQDLIVTGRRWIRHPILSVKFAWRLDLFPELHSAEVWEMTVRQTRGKVLDKVAGVKRRHRGKATGTDTGTPEVHTVNSPGEVVNSLSVPAETAAETTAERNLKLTVLVAAFYLNKEGVHPQRSQKFVSAAAGAAQSYTSRVFAECRKGEHERPEDTVMADVAEHFAKFAVNSASTTS
jgi:hypothetical protein